MKIKKGNLSVAFLLNMIILLPILAKQVKIGFFINHMSIGGVEVSTYDYADFNETILGNISYILNYTEYANRPGNYENPDHSRTANEKFINRFGSRYFNCNSMQEIDEVIQKENIDIFYVQKAGEIDNKISKVCKNAVHAVFTDLQPHGDVYAGISRWLSNIYRYAKLPYVPYMVRLYDTQDNLRSELGIPHEAVVFGRHGGYGSFDIAFVHEAVREVAHAHPDWYFVFLNTAKFCDLANVIFLPSTANMEYKTKFINTCDVMIHARHRGETFGLACAEFSIKNKPVITWLGSYERNHIEVLSNKGLYYNDKADLLNLINFCGNNISEIRSGDWDAYSKEFIPEIVMKKFHDVFIRPCLQ